MKKLRYGFEKRNKQVWGWTKIIFHLKKEKMKKLGSRILTRRRISAAERWQPRTWCCSRTEGGQAQAPDLSNKSARTLGELRPTGGTSASRSGRNPRLWRPKSGFFPPPESGERRRKVCCLEEEMKKVTELMLLHPLKTYFLATDWGYSRFVDRPRTINKLNA